MSDFNPNLTVGPQSESTDVSWERWNAMSQDQRDSAEQAMYENLLITAMIFGVDHLRAEIFDKIPADEDSPFADVTRRTCNRLFDQFKGDV